MERFTLKPLIHQIQASAAHSTIIREDILKTRWDIRMKECNTFRIL